MLPRTIFFDMDDTLLDGVSAWTVAWETACLDYGPRVGVEPTVLRETIRRHSQEFWQDEAAVGHWRLDLDGARVAVVTRAMEELGCGTTHAREMAIEYGQRHRDNLEPFDDAIETVTALRTAGYRTGLLTNGDSKGQRAKIEKAGLEPLMDVIVIEGEFGKGKPERDVFLHALAATGSRPEEAWHVGDNLYADIGGAKGAGLHAVWIHRDRLTPPGSNGTTPPGGVRETPAFETGAVPDRIIAHLPELREALL